MPPCPPPPPSRVSVSFLLLLLRRLPALTANAWRNNRARCKFHVNCVEYAVAGVAEKVDAVVLPSRIEYTREADGVDEDEKDDADEDEKDNGNDEDFKPIDWSRPPRPLDCFTGIFPPFSRSCAPSVAAVLCFIDENDVYDGDAADEDDASAAARVSKSAPAFAGTTEDRLCGSMSAESPCVEEEEGEVACPSSFASLPPAGKPSSFSSPKFVCSVFVTSYVYEKYQSRPWSIADKTCTYIPKYINYLRTLKYIAMYLQKCIPGFCSGRSCSRECGRPCLYRRQEKAPHLSPQRRFSRRSRPHLRDGR